MFGKKRITAEEFQKANAIKRRARQSSPDEQRQAAVKGIQKYAVRFEVAGDPATAAVLSDLAKKATEQIEAERAAQAELSAPRENFVADAAEAAAVELCKKLPVSFPTPEDGLNFASKLPLIEARAAARAASDKAYKTSRRLAKARQMASELIDRGACLATGQADPNAARKLAAAAGV